MTISYNWLNEYIPVGQAGLTENIEPEKLAKILTAIGLEVESIERSEEIKGGLKGLLVGEVISCEKHPDADKLKLTTVSVSNGKLLNIVCGASNVAVGQKVVVAPVGTVIYPVNGDPINIKKAKIRGVESEGMICAEDEIGMGSDHHGIMVLPAETVSGTAVAEIFKPREDHVFEIGLTPNRIDAMSHLGVAKDVCAYLSHHNKAEISAVSPYKNNFKPDSQSQKIDVIIENKNACKRYSGICISGITITDSPPWLQDRLKSIGLKPISNIVDITNFILHETGQPLHAFDADKIKGKKILVRSAAEGESFTTLDGKERKLFANDLLICDETAGMCLAGVYGGIVSGVTNETKNIFIESAWFDPSYIRKTSLKHGLRTDAAARFEKGTDISNTVNVLKRAALLIKEITGGEISSDVIDVYPTPLQKTTVGLKNHYLKKLSGKNYHSDTIKNILKSLGFELVKEGADEIWVDVPFSKPDISLPADIVEEIMRIDGLDNIEIPVAITIAPAVEKDLIKYQQKEKLANYLTGLGFYEIFTNSITNSDFYDETVLEHSVKMINNLSEDLDIMRPEMLQGGLQVIAHNNNRKNFNLRLFEFGKTYSISAEKKYDEINHLSLYTSGNTNEQDWKIKPAKTDFYYLKGAVENLLALSGFNEVSFGETVKKHFHNCTEIRIGNNVIGYLGETDNKTLKQFDIRQPVFYADILWDEILSLGKNKTVTYREVSRFPAVIRDLSVVVDKNVSYSWIEKITAVAGIEALRSMQLFDVFESDKLGAGKKAMAISFTFLDDSKTLTDIEIDSFMQKIITAYEKDLRATIRK
ncbi:MAG: phenylalanine--tRNA ligase subunit beta [Ferruginibacter sp.]